MTNDRSMPAFDEYADFFWRLGVMQSPSQLQGYLLGMLAVGHPFSSDQWCEMAVAAMEPAGELEQDELQLLSDLHKVAAKQLEEGISELSLLLPDDEVEITQRVDSLGSWCRGFLAGFALGGKQRQQQQGQQQYSTDVSDALSDLAAISQISLGEGDEEEQDREQNYVEIRDYLRLAAINIYLDCHSPSTSSEHISDTTNNSDNDTKLATPANLFKPSNDKLH